jgi:bacterioferritin-associated ferredoxin
MADIRERLGVASECGKCGRHALSIISEFKGLASFVDAVRA